MKWESKIVIVTGANTGIGKATKDLLRNKGCIVYNLDLALAEDEIPEYFVHCDVRDRQQIKKAVNQVYDKEKRIDMVLPKKVPIIEGSISGCRSSPA